MISSFIYDVGDVCALLHFFTFEDGTDTLFQNVGMELPLYTALYPRRVQISSSVVTDHHHNSTNQNKIQSYDRLQKHALPILICLDVFSCYIMLPQS